MKNTHVKVTVGIFTHSLDCSYHTNGRVACDCENSSVASPQIERNEQVLVFDQVRVDKWTDFFIVMTGKGIKTFYLPKDQSNVYLDIISTCVQARAAA